MKNKVDVFCAVPLDAGWAPIHHMTNLLASYLGTRSINVNVKFSLHKTTRILSLIPRLKGGENVAIVIAYDPGQLYAIAQTSYIFKRYKKIIGWVIDSFWSDKLPKIALNNKTYDHIFVMDEDDIKPWRDKGVINISSLPWGADVYENIDFRLHNIITKDIDVLRVGRQPAAWESDQNNSKTLQNINLKYHGRPEFGSNQKDSYQNLRQKLEKAKVVLAFSTKVSQTDYTHPEREYLTGRWTDALASGCIVAGRRPKSGSTMKILWAGATHEIKHNDVTVGAQELRTIIDNWSPRQSKINILNSLRYLDWRWRFSELLSKANLKSNDLERDLLSIETYLVNKENNN